MKAFYDHYYKIIYYYVIMTIYNKVIKDFDI